MPIIQRLPEIVYPLTQISKVNEIVDVLNNNLNTFYSEENPLLTPSQGVCTWVVTHNLNSEDINCTVYYNDISVIVPVEVTSPDTVSIQMNSSSNISLGTYKVVITANGSGNSTLIGKWFQSPNETVLYSGSNTESHTISLNSILPEGYSQYEVIFVTQVIAARGAAGDYINAEFSTSFGNFSFGACNSSTTSTNGVIVTTTTVPVGSNRSFTIKARSNDKGTFNVSVRAYKIIY